MSLAKFHHVFKTIIMTKEELRIVYMGTPDFAVEPLQKLYEGGYKIGRASCRERV